MVFAFKLDDVCFSGAVSYGGEVFTDLLVLCFELFLLLFAVPWLVFLVDDLVELFMQEDGESLFAVLGRRKEIGVVIWYLAYVVGDVGHMRMIGQPALVVRG